MSRTKASGPDRRELFGLTAAAVASVAAAGAATSAIAEPSRPGAAARGPGIPVPTPVVQTRAGAVQGLVEDGVLAFKGVRYGAAPIGKLRFMPPQPAEPWTGIYDATDFGAPAMQMAGGATVDTTSDAGLQMHRVFTTPSELKIMNEDCLFLNVWTPGVDARKRPVMVWIHGGGFAYGSGAQPIYQCDGLARFGDVVTVSVNHRLNVFGYLHLGDLMGPAYASSGTVGMQDLVLALRWIRDNIAAFGGDPDSVMIMGQSGGGQKVCLLLSMDSAKGLFHKASIESGASPVVGRKERANEAAKRVLAELNIAPGDIAALQALPAQTLLAAAAKAGVGGAGVGGPILDGVAITRDPFLPDAPDVSADVPILIGWCKDEWTIFTAGEPWFGKLTEVDLQERMKPLGETGQKLLAAYRKAYPNYSPTYLWEQVMSARVMQGTEFVAERKAAKGRAPAYVWFMTWETPVQGGIFKTPHTMEIPFALYSFDKVRTFVGEGPQPKQMADQIAGAWVAFARTGKPDHPGIPHWPPFTAADRSVMEFNLTSRVVNDPLSEVRQLLTQMSPTTMPRG
ncbi:MAG TPA: carboxylesterase family protein [Caulobacteraceae bacterium]|nr:carboxylesterase family protein [Caulobacteraceae bacterium]